MATLDLEGATATGQTMSEGKRKEMTGAFPVTLMLVMELLVMELAGMWQRDVVRATPWVVVRYCSQTSRRHEWTWLAGA